MIGLFVLALLGFSVDRLLLGRTTLLWIGPKDASVIDIVGRSALEQVQNHLGNAPLFDGKPVTLNTFAPFVRGEAALIVLPTGSRAFAYRGTLTDPLRSSLTSYGIRLVSDTHGVVILSDVDTQNLSLGGGLHFTLASLMPGFGGVARQNGKTAPVFFAADGFSVGRVGAQPEAKSIPGLIAWISIDADNQPFFSSVEPIMGYGMGKTLPALLGSTSGSALLVKDDQGLAYRLQLNSAIGSQDLADLLNHSVALNEPSTVPLTLEDGSSVDELRSDPDLIKTSIQDQGSAGTTITVEGSNVHLVAQTIGQSTVVTNRSSLLAGPFTFGHGVSVVKTDALVSMAASQVTKSDARIGLLSSTSEIDISGGNFAVRW